MDSRGAVLQDGVLRLRPARLPSDVNLALHWYQDPEVLRFSEGDGTAPYDETVVRAMYDALASSGELYIVEVRLSTGWLAIGDAALCPDALPIVIGEPSFRSRGFGTQVLRLLIERARALGWQRLVVKGVYAYNLRARRLYERAGFHIVGDGHLDQPSWRLELHLDQSTTLAPIATHAVQIRIAHTADLDAVVQLQHRWVREEITYGYLPAERDDLLPLLGPYFLVAERSGVIVGFAQGTLVPAERSRGSAVIPAGTPYLDIEEVYVDRPHRDQRIGGLLLDRLLETARANGVHRFLLYSSSKDLDGILRFYRAHGFRSWAVQLYQ